MKYRHAYHAGNFADVHKHVVLIALLDALARKPKGFLYLDTHAGAGRYDLSDAAARRGGEAERGIGRLQGSPAQAAEIRAYLDVVAAIRQELGKPHIYPGSPLIAAHRLRAQDRATVIESEPQSASVLRRVLEHDRRFRVEHDDGFARLRAHLPPRERRGIVLIDPPYEETQRDFARLSAAVGEALERFATGVIAAWYPIKDRRDTDRWWQMLARGIAREVLISELWIYPPDSDAGLNGSGLLIVNPPYLIAERMREWLPELQQCLAPSAGAGVRVELLPGSGG